MKYTETRRGLVSEPLEDVFTTEDCGLESHASRDALEGFFATFSVRGVEQMAVAVAITASKATDAG